MSCFCFQYYTFRKQYWTAVVSLLWQRVENELYFIVSCGSQITPSFLYPAEANCQIWVGENRIKSTELLGLSLQWVRQVLVGWQQGMVKKRQEAMVIGGEVVWGANEAAREIATVRWAVWAASDRYFSPNHLVYYNFVILFLFFFLFETRKSFAVSLLSSKIIAFCEKADGEHYWSVLAKTSSKFEKAMHAFVEEWEYLQYGVYLCKWS